MGLGTEGSALYAFGGGWDQALDFHERYDPFSNTWSTVASPFSGPGGTWASRRWGRCCTWPAAGTATTARCMSSTRRGSGRSCRRRRSEAIVDRDLKF
ncbi:MAG: hypothetical protein HZY76_05520 [Anaerolineae bacterium]|nr:MAG: hypothetical protein HZY76_05520 [Anaerolineae bacterium]